jgi:hypothetical protein
LAFERAVVIEMLGIDVGDDRDIAGSLTKVPSDSSASTTIQSPPCRAGIGAIGIDDAAVDDGRVEAAGIEQRATSDVVVVLPCVPPMAMGLETHQFGQHFGAAHDRQAAARAAISSGLSLDRRRNDDDLRVAEVLRRMADGTPMPIAQALHIVVLGTVRALHLVAQVPRTSAMPLMPMPPMPMKWIVPSLRGSFMYPRRRFNALLLPPS